MYLKLQTGFNLHLSFQTQILGVGVPGVNGVNVLPLVLGEREIATGSVIHLLLSMGPNFVR